MNDINYKLSVCERRISDLENKVNLCLVYIAVLVFVVCFNSYKYNQKFQQQTQEIQKLNSK